MNEPNASIKRDLTSGIGNIAQEAHMVLKDARFAHRADALFRALSSDYLLREQFVSDPARVVADYVMDERVSDELADTANQLLYAVVSNQRLTYWLHSYGRRLNGKVPSRHAFAGNLSQAVASSGDNVAVLAIVHAASSDRDHFSLQADLLRAVAVVIGSHGGGNSGTEMTPGPGPGTEATPGPGPGTEVSPGGRVSIRDMAQALQLLQRVVRGNPGAFSSGTEMTPGPGPGTEATPGPGPGTEVSPGGRVSIREMAQVLQLIQRVVRGNPGAFSSGTEMTPGPGPGTEATPGPGPGTEVSLGGRVSIRELAQVLQLIQRVMRSNPAVFTTGTEMTPGPGPGTEATPGPGPGTEVSPGGRVSIREMTQVLQLIQRVMRSSPAVFTTGTEMTPGPGPGTEATPGPGPGTEVSPGGIFSWKGSLAVTMNALARYAMRLRENRALFISGIEGR